MHDVRATHTLIRPISAVFPSTFSVGTCAKAGSSCHQNTALVRALLMLLLLFTLLRVRLAALLKASCQKCNNHSINMNPRNSRWLLTKMQCHRHLERLPFVSAPPV